MTNGVENKVNFFYDIFMLFGWVTLAEMCLPKVNIGNEGQTRTLVGGSTDVDPKTGKYLDLKYRG